MNQNRIGGALKFKNCTIIPKKSRSEQRVRTIGLKNSVRRRWFLENRMMKTKQKPNEDGGKRQHRIALENLLCIVGWS